MVDCIVRSNSQKPYAKHSYNGGLEMCVPNRYTVAATVPTTAALSTAPITVQIDWFTYRTTCNLTRTTECTSNLVNGTLVQLHRQPRSQSEKYRIIYRTQRFRMSPSFWYLYYCIDFSSFLSVHHWESECGSDWKYPKSFSKQRKSCRAVQFGACDWLDHNTQCRRCCVVGIWKVVSATIP